MFISVAFELVNSSSLTSSSLTTLYRRKRDDADDALCGISTTLNDAAIGATIGKAGEGKNYGR